MATSDTQRHGIADQITSPHLPTPFTTSSVTLQPIVHPPPTHRFTGEISSPPTALTDLLSEILLLPLTKNTLEHSSGANIDCTLTIRSKAFGRGCLRDTHCTTQPCRSMSTPPLQERRRQTDHCSPGRSRRDAPYRHPTNQSRCAIQAPTHGDPSS
jgi:hypothetical protein